MTTRLLTLIALTATLAACSTVPERNSDLDRARGRFNMAQRDAQVVTLAPEELNIARTTMDQAQNAWDQKQPKATVDHLSYMTAQRVIIAQETASSRAAQAITANASAERDKLLLAQRTAEADLAHQKLAAAERSNVQKTNQLAQADAAAKQDQARIDYSDARAHALELELKDLNAKKTERGFVITLGDVLFDSGQDRLLPEGAGYMVRLADAFKRNTALTAAIEGYTDSVGSSESNMELSARRARTVMAALMGQGVLSSQLSVRAMGENNPAASNDTSAGRQMNRRVEIVFTPNSGVVIAN
jgi:outer membrane protein OmpA-like peptidoglycan-associated protein